MNIEAIAIEAGLTSYHAKGHYFKQCMKRFAALIREALIAELVAGSGEPVGVHDYQPTFTRDQLAGAVARERERCAQAAEKQARWIGYNAHAEAIAAAIREQT